MVGTAKATLSITWAGNIFVEETRKAADEMIRDVGLKAKDIARSLVSVDTGALRDSIDLSQVDFMVWVLYASAAHGIYNELGTVYQAPRPFIRPAVEMAGVGSHRLMAKALNGRGNLQRLRM